MNDFVNGKIYFNDGWKFSPAFDESLLKKECNIELQDVRIPHTVCETPFNCFDESEYQKISGYRRTFITEKEWKGKIVLLTIEAAAHYAEVYLNGNLVCTHSSGYTSFTCNLTEYLADEGEENILAVKVDSREVLDQPPFGFVIDYMTYGGIYRDVWLEVKNPVYIKDVVIQTKKNDFTSRVILNTQKKDASLTIRQCIRSWNNPEKECAAEIYTGVKGIETLTGASASPVRLWKTDSPELYVLTTELYDENDVLIDCKEIRFGFRDIRFDETGFYLNNEKIKLRGLNRHQSFPYVGYAMPKNIQRDDADILKYELGLNEVRTSHYPQSRHFIDRCDEIGLLVFTEIPGWQHIGGEEWKNIAVQNVREMVSEYRNHPSVFMWGVRINESPDDDEFYERTNKAARELDSTRPTAGVRNEKSGNLLEDVFTYNDFSFSGKNAGLLPKRKVTSTKKGYMVTEFNGHMFPTKSFDCEKHRVEHAIRHAEVLNAMYADSEIAGASGWCAFDYNTHKDFGSGDRICYHGVMDMFRNAKIAAALYRSQAPVEQTGDVLEISSSMDIGEYAATIRGIVWIFTNAPSVRFYINDVFIKEYKSSDSPFKNLPHGPVPVDDYIGTRLMDEEKIPEKTASVLKQIYYDVQLYGTDYLPLKTKLKVIYLVASGKMKMNKIWELGGKYICNWGQSRVTYRFDAVRNGTIVKSVTKTTSSRIKLELNCSRTELFEAESYDAACVHIKAVDEYGNLQSYYQEAVTVKTSGELILIGPDSVSLKGGQVSVYVKTTGKCGEGVLTVTDVRNEKYSMKFSVSKK